MVYKLKKKLLSQAQILDGINEQAKEQNHKIISMLKYAGDIINKKYPNDAFGLLLKGSRIKGYHTAESDVDLIVVSPEECDNRENIYDILVETKKKKGLERIVLCGGPQMWDSMINLDEFLYQCDHDPLFLNSMLGYELSSNPNLLMARLIALKVVKEYDGRFSWNFVRERYNDDYLGERGHMNPKVAKRFNIPLQEVNRVLNPSIWEERHSKFTLPNWEDLLSRYEIEFKKLKRKGEFVMYDTYKKVTQDLELGF